MFAQYPIEVVSGQGVWLTNSRGERVLDLYGGHAVAALGYGHPGWTRALTKQARILQLPDRTPCRCRFARARPSGWCAFRGCRFTSVFFVNSGAEANENALKLAFQHDRPLAGLLRSKAASTAALPVRAP